MAKHKGRKPSKPKSVPLNFIKDTEEQKSISTSDLGELEKIGYPLFSFKYLQNVSFTDNRVPARFFQDFLKRLCKYSELGWKEIDTAPKHTFGWESMDRSKMKHQLPSEVTPDVNLIVLRSSGDNRALVGFRMWKIFHVIFIEANFNDIYEH